MKTEADLPRLVEFIETELPLGKLDAVVELVGDDTNLEIPPYVGRPEKAIYLRQAQMLNVEESISHLAYQLSWQYLDRLDEPGEFVKRSSWLAEIIPAFFGFGCLMANSTVKPASSNDGQFEHRTSCLLYTSPSPRDGLLPRMPSSA